MTHHILNLANRDDTRRALKSPSSSFASQAGLDLDDIVPAYADRKQTAMVRTAPPSLDERAFTALANAKVWTSRVAMHLDLNARDRYFRQLDLLHDSDEWVVDESPVVLGSYQNFIRFMLVLGGNSKPSLALSSSGNLHAIWQREADRLTVEFLPKDRVEWVISRREGDAVERAAGSTTTERLQANLAPYAPERWFNVGN